MRIDGSEPPKTGNPAITALAQSIGLYLLLAGVFWTGFAQGDAVHYARFALNTVENFPYQGEIHWALRHPLVLPMAASIAMFGASEFVASLPSLFYGAALVIISHIFGHRFLGAGAGRVLGLFVASSAFLSLHPLGIDIATPELVFAVLAIWRFLESLAKYDAGRRPLWGGLFLAGSCAGLSWLCRETAGYLPVVFIAGAVVMAPRGDRIRVALLACGGFGAVLCVEMLVYYMTTGTPFYRYVLSLGHGDGHVQSRHFADMGNQPIWLFLTTPLNRLATSPSVTPMLVLAVFASLWLWRKPLSSDARRMLVLLGFAGGFSLLLSGYVLSLERPRYYPVLGYWAFVVLAAASPHLSRQFGKRVAVAWVVGICALGPIVADIGRDPRTAEFRTLAGLAQAHEGAIVADPLAVLWGEMYLRLSGMSALQADAALEFPAALAPGALVFVPGASALDPALAPQPDWIVTKTIENSNSSVLGPVLRLVLRCAKWTGPIAGYCAPVPPAALYSVPRSVGGRGA
ncbi:MAG: hypothetical protein ACJA1F_000512 [Paracoccaceae bacterium]|jgi:hypothetical protein